MPFVAGGASSAEALSSFPTALSLGCVAGATRMREDFVVPDGFTFGGANGVGSFAGAGTELAAVGSGTIAVLGSKIVLCM